MEHDSPKIWEDRIKQWSASGLSVRDWCSQNGVDTKQFYIWRNRMQRNEPETESPVFAELTSAPAYHDGRHSRYPTGQDSRPMLYYQGMKLYIPENFNPDTLLSLLRTLKRL